MLNRELVKGSTVILVLTLLNERPMYGYELVKEMGSRSGNELQMKEGPCILLFTSLNAKDIFLPTGRSRRKDRTANITGLQTKAKKCWRNARRNGAYFQP